MPEEAAEGEFSPDQDDLLEEAIRLVAQTQTASVSMVQRRLRVGYTRAGRLIDMLERRGVISGYEGSKPRQVLITRGRRVARARRRRRRRAGAATADAEPSPATRTELRSRSAGGSNRRQSGDAGFRCLSPACRLALPCR